MTDMGEGTKISGEVCISVEGDECICSGDFGGRWRSSGYLCFELEAVRRCAGVPSPKFAGGAGSCCRNWLGGRLLRGMDMGAFCAASALWELGSFFKL